MKSPSFRAMSLLFFFFFFFFLSVSKFSFADETVLQECSKQFETVTSCLSFVTGTAAVPTPACCTAVTGIRNSDPKCMCFIIQQAHNGSAELKSLGIQEAKLLLLPSACSLNNLNISKCPELLGISPTSPDAAIFNITLPAPASTTTTTSPSANGVSGASHGHHGVYGVAALLPFAMALISLALVSIYHTAL